MNAPEPRPGGENENKARYCLLYSIESFGRFWNFYCPPHRKFLRAEVSGSSRNFAALNIYGEGYSNRLNRATRLRPGLVQLGAARIRGTEKFVRDFERKVNGSRRRSPRDLSALKDLPSCLTRMDPPRTVAFASRRISGYMYSINTRTRRFRTKGGWRFNGAWSDLRMFDNYSKFMETLRVRVPCEF